MCSADLKADASANLMVPANGRSLALCPLGITVFSNTESCWLRTIFKEREDDTSQLNRLVMGQAHRYKTVSWMNKIIGAQLSVIALSHSGSNDLQQLANSSSGSNCELAT